MKNLFLSAIALAAVFVLPGVASADEAGDRSAAIQLCRAEVSAQAGPDAQVRLDQLQVRRRNIRVDLDVWRNGQLQNVRCDVARGNELTIASIRPAVQTAAR